MELLQKKIACLICFSGLTIILIWEPDGPEWLSMIREKGFDRAIHNIENAPFRTKFDKDFSEMHGTMGIGCISDYEPQPLIVRSHHGTYAIVTVGKINNTDKIVNQLFASGHSHFLEMSGGDINATELVASIINQKSNLN